LDLPSNFTKCNLKCNLTIFTTLRNEKIPASARDLTI
jgi:hypothetical protein